MSQPDLDLMLWALSRGWRMSVFSGPTPGSLWRDPTRRRFLVHAPGRAADLPVLSEEVRTRLLEARAAAARPPPGLSHGIYHPDWPLAHRLAPVGVFLRSVPARPSPQRYATPTAHLNGSLAACRAAGFWIALDDAGAGRCGLQAIVEVVPDVVKVDRALAGGMDQHRGRRAAVAALARLARDLGIVLVAEGIETQGELRVARDLGVRCAPPPRLPRPFARRRGRRFPPSRPSARRVTGLVTGPPRRSTRTRLRRAERRSSIRAEKAPTSARASGHAGD